MKSTSMLAAATMLAGLVVATGAQAINRYESRSMSCANIQATIQAEGEAIFRWIQPPNIQRYDRYIANQNFCYAATVPYRDYIPAADTGSCAVDRCKTCTPLDRREGRC